MRLIEITVVLLGTIGLFLIVNFVHFRYFEVEVILYACLLDATIACLVFFAGYQYVWRKRSKLSGIEKSLTGIVAFLTITVYAVMGPTVVDRSLSLYIVEKLDSRGGAIAVAALPEVFIREYMPEYRLVDVRLTEQVASGTAVISDGCVRLTDRGRLVAALSHFYRTAFMPRKRVLLGSVTDALVDPLRTSIPVVDTACKTSLP